MWLGESGDKISGEIRPRTKQGKEDYLEISRLDLTEDINDDR